MQTLMQKSRPTTLNHASAMGNPDGHAGRSLIRDADSGKRTKIDWLEVQWPLPSGAVERLTQLPLDRYITIVEGEGKWS